MYECECEVLMSFQLKFQRVSNRFLAAFPIRSAKIERKEYKRKILAFLERLAPSCVHFKNEGVFDRVLSKSNFWPLLTSSPPYLSYQHVMPCKGKIQALSKHSMHKLKFGALSHSLPFCVHCA